MAPMPAFLIERWMDLYETTCDHNLAETCCDSISLDDIEKYVKKANLDAATAGDCAILQPLQGRKLTYGHVRGSPELRSRIASLYRPSVPLAADNILITQGAIGANYLTLTGVVSAGDHVVCTHPTYQQLFEVPRAQGAHVDMWRWSPEDDWEPSLESLSKLLRPDTRLMIINNPNNPTGEALPSATLHGIVDTVRRTAGPGCLILCDEVYRPLVHSPRQGATTSDYPSILDLNDPNVIATGSMSKAWSMAGIRLGWIATTRSDILEDLAGRRDYNVISVSQVDDLIASTVLHKEVRAQLLQRNTDLARTNLDLLEKFLQTTDKLQWKRRPQAGTTAMLQIKGNNDDEAFCRSLLKHSGVLLGPGTCFGYPGWVRIGYACSTPELREGLAKMSVYLEQ